MNYDEFLSVMRSDMLASDRASSNVAEVIAHHIAQVMHLESVLLFLGDDIRQSRLVASAGRRANDVIRHVLPEIEPHLQDSAKRELTEVRWRADSLLLANLRPSGRFLGYILLGPKDGGDIFIEEEKRLAATVLPSLAVAIEKSGLSDELRCLNTSLLEAGEMERRRVAGDLHDGPLQKALLLAGASGSSLENTRSLAGQIVSELREICSRLRPAVLDDLGLVSALDWLLEGVSRQSGLVTYLEVRKLGDEERFSSDIEVALFRITQEATSNVIKHAGASHINVMLALQGQDLVLEVRDNGIGFSLSSQVKRGFGLSEMRERVTQLNGQLKIDSVIGLGTAIIAHVPARHS